MAEKQTHGFLEQIRSPEISSWSIFFFQLSTHPPLLSLQWGIFFFLSFLTVPWGMQDLSFPTKNQTHAPTVEVCVNVCVKSLSRVRLFETLWTVARQAPLSMGFSRQEYWIGLPFPSPGDLPNPGIEPGSPALQADALSSEPPGTPSKSIWMVGTSTLRN